MWIFHFFIFVVWLSHASSLPKVRLRFKVCELCSYLNVVIHSFCLTNIRSKSWANSRSAFFFFSSVFGSHDRSFDPSVVDKEPALAMGTFSFGIIAFSKFALFAVFFSCLVIFTFALDRSSTSVGPSKSSNVSFYHWSNLGPYIWVQCNFPWNDLDFRHDSRIECGHCTILEIGA